MDGPTDGDIARLRERALAAIQAGDLARAAGVAERALGEGLQDQLFFKLRAIGQKDGSLWFVFRDRTSGRTTHGGARQLDADAPRNGVVVLDFNKAINPPCAFTDFAVCPLPPPENVLPFRIEAGEKRIAV